jgi:hypothetical protein
MERVQQRDLFLRTEEQQRRECEQAYECPVGSIGAWNEWSRVTVLAFNRRRGERGRRRFSPRGLAVVSRRTVPESQSFIHTGVTSHEGQLLPDVATAAKRKESGDRRIVHHDESKGDASEPVQ